ncbi:GAF domain-containing protein [Flammeovirga yaeyamensis]|uniref:GAF domain-containing protein n=1 Tax=Flammeovirga yaeyamensis TaxID=367791 RepID=A0AAX1N540_9BACT|nr:MULTISPECIES: GAF domain-containing protein [Flammeovirga]ANQ47618.1 GAF domain-containing protein [Flammeovirga sp. MY04]MBB3698661.1 transcriptional regulator with GAF, ATPase, and Fis domain [Flammeovirga yaeyamensis]NMF33994.1 GAF domain-containing protein [Flammeovirga yaeyamensis]QWG00983.1 GAF domain-containing protein [Flammeovirga yaeyamensis]
MKTGYLDQALSIYQDLSRALTTKDLSKKILQTIHSRSIAEKASIIIKSGDDFILKAYKKRNEEDIHFSDEHIQAEKNELPLAILRQIKTPKSTIVVNMDKVNEQIKTDAYITEHQPQYLNFIPLWNQDTMIGFLMLDQYQNINTPSEQIKFLQVLAPQMAILLQKSFFDITHQEVKEEKEDIQANNTQIKGFEIQAIQEVGQLIAATDSLDKMTVTVYEKINQILDAKTLDIGVVNKETHMLEFPATYDNGNKLPFNSCSLNEEDRLSTLCIKSNKPIHINNFDEEISSYLPKFYSKFDHEAESAAIQSLIYVPIQYKNETVGVFTVQTDKKDAYSLQDKILVQGIGSYIGIAIENIRLKAKTNVQSQVSEEQEEQLTMAYNALKNLGEIGQDITSNLSIEGISNTAYESLNSMIEAPLYSMGIYNKERGVLEITTNIENGEKLPPKTIRLTDNDKLSVICFKQLKEIVINDIMVDYNLYLPDQELPKSELSGLPQSLIYIPLIGKEGTLGFITIQSYQANAFGERALNLMKNIAIYIGIALDNALTYEGLEEIVADRTAELQHQKQEIENSRDQIEQSYKNVQLISNIGIELSSDLNTENIIKTLYQNISDLMKVDSFGLGIYHHRRQEIEFIGAMEKGKQLPDFTHSMGDNTRLSSLCLRENKEVVINDITTEISNYLDLGEDAVIDVKAGEMPMSVIYIPLVTKEKLMGVISVQSFDKNAYTDRHVDILRNIAVLSAIAIDNASSYEKIERQKEELQSTSQKITQSIKYAKQIQGSILPNRTLIRSLLPDSFIFHKPKDIVSGDFFWFLEHGNKIFISTVDCNSNGVPGAMMSIIGISLFREIVEIRGIVCPGEILEAMNTRLMAHLNQSTSDNSDSLDVSMVVIDKDKNVMEFAGANTQMARVVNNKFFIIKGSKHTIGGDQPQKGEAIKFQKHSFNLDEDANYYLFTDGYQKQIGGKDKGEFGKENFLKLLYQNHKEEKTKQRTAVRRAFNDWMENELTQTDDVLVLGFNPSKS